MIDRSTEIIKQLNRLANDRNLTPQARKNISEAIRHIRELHEGVARIRELHFKLINGKRKPAQDQIEEPG